MARPKKWNSESERIAAYRAGKREQIVDPELPEIDVNEPEPAPPAGTRSIETLLSLDPFAPLSEVEEHILRVHFGYADSEKRTRAERQAVANRLRDPHALTARTTTRYKMDGTPVEERVGPAGLSLVAFPVQRRGDMTPSAEKLAKLG